MQPSELNQGATKVTFGIHKKSIHNEYVNVTKKSYQMSDNRSSWDNYKATRSEGRHKELYVLLEKNGGSTDSFMS